MNVVCEAFHKIVLCSQRDTPVTQKKYRKTLLLHIKGALVIKLRKRYTQEFQQILPVSEHKALLDLLIRFHHTSQFGNIKAGYAFHSSAELTLKSIYASKYAFFSVRLLEKVNFFCKYCRTYSLLRPTPALLHEGTRVAGDIGFSDKPYSHISVDNTTLGLEKSYSHSKFSHKNNVLVVTCLFTNHVTIKTRSFFLRSRQG